MLDLLPTHPFISDPIITDEFQKKNVPWESPLRAYFQNEIMVPLSKDIGTDIENRRPDYFKYKLLGFVHSHDLIFPWVAFQPFEFKLIAPIRHPRSFLIESSFYRPDGRLDETFKNYLWLISLLKNTDNSIFIPIDLLEKLDPEMRLKEMEYVFCDFLGLEMTEEVKEKVLSWKKIDEPPPQSIRPLLPEELTYIERNLKESTILQQLHLLGVDYAETIEDTQTVFSYSNL